MYRKKQLKRDQFGSIIPQYWDTQINDFRPSTNHRRTKEQPFTTTVEVKDTATTANQYKNDLGIQYIHYISNDGNVDLFVGFSAPSTGTSNRITIKAGEVVSGLNLAVNAIHYSCTSGTCPFRIVGVK